MQYASAQIGKPYIFGVEVQASDKNPRAFDCSELVEWALAQVGVTIPDGSMRQLEYCREAGCEITVQQAIDTRAALLFRDDGEGRGHVAISLGNGHTIEARGKAYGVVEAKTAGRAWTAGALIPGLYYPEPAPPDEGHSGSSIRA